MYSNVIARTRQLAGTKQSHYNRTKDMYKFTMITSTCICIPTENIDTDQIIPAGFLRITGKNGFGKYLFYNWRYNDEGKPQKNKYFHDSNHKGPQILIAGNNFGCGSSREHAVWALVDYGFKAVISSSFGDIFYNNSLKNGLLPVILKPEELEQLFKIVDNNSEIKVIIDLNKQSVNCHPELVSGFLSFHFPIDSFRKTCLLKEVDELGYILSFEKQIHKYEIINHI